MRPTFTIWVFAIITDEEDRILLCLRHDYDIRNLPGWGLESGESPREGVLREVKEETGLDAEVTRLVGLYSKPDKDEMVFLFTCNVIWGELTLNEEAKDIQYFLHNALPEHTVPKQIERIEDYFSSHNQTILKVQGGQSTKDRIKEGQL